MRVFIDSTGYFNILSNSDGSSYLDNIIKLSKEDKFKIIFPKITEFEVYKGRLGASQRD